MISAASRRASTMIGVLRPVLVAVCICSLALGAHRADSAIYFNVWNITDGSLFGISCAVTMRGPDGVVQAPPGVYAGYQNSFVAKPDNFNTLTSSSAFRMGVMSDFLLMLAVGYLEKRGQMPFSRSSPIPLTYLPASLQNVLGNSSASDAYLFNPHFGTRASFISINMLLEHTSSLNEEGFDTYGILQGPLSSSEGSVLPTRAAFLESLFAGVGADAFSRTCEPSSAIDVWAQNGCFNYSRLNTALAGYVVETILTVQQMPITNLETYVYTNIMIPLQLSSTFFLDKRGLFPLPAYPPGLSNDVAKQLYESTTVANVNSSWSGIVQSFAIAADPLSDMMVYTTTEDLQRILAYVVLPGSTYHTAFGVDQFRSTSIQLTRSGGPVSDSDITDTMRSAAVSGAVSRGLGFTTVNLTALCASVASQVVGGCYPGRWNVSSDTGAYGMASTTPFNQVAILCTTNTYTQTDICMTAMVAYTDSSTLMPIRYAHNNAMTLAFAFLQQFMIDSYTPPQDRTAPNLTGLWIFMGVLVTIVVSVVLSYLTDYFVQPLPPAKAVAPVPGARVGGLGVGNGWGAGAVSGSQLIVPNALSPLPAVNLFGDTEDENDTTPLRPDVSSVTHGTIGSATSGRRGRRHGGTAALSVESSSTRSGALRHRGGGGESTTGSSSSPRSVARFDAYI